MATAVVPGVVDIYAQLRRDEGFRKFPYPDSKGITTIGYGRNLQANGISMAEAEVMLHNDVAVVTSKLHTALPWTIDLDPVRFAVLINMGFNMGIVKEEGFHTTLALVKVGRYADAAAAMRKSLWAHEVGAREERLAKQMETGQWQ